MYFSRSELLGLLQKMSELCGAKDCYTEHMAADAWGQAIDVRNPNARRFDLSGALIAAVDELCDPQGEHKDLVKQETSKIEHKRVQAKKLLRKRGEHARILYGYGWALLDAASREVTSAGLWERKTFRTAMDVLDRAKLRLCESLNIRSRESPLGMAKIDDPYMLEEVELLAKITSAGEPGYTISPEEILATYDLYRRGLIIERWPLPWTYRRRVLFP